MSIGIDVSNNNGAVDWHAVAATGVRFAYAKATEGTTFIDTFYEANRAGAEAHGIKFGAFHFYDPAADPAAQVAFFLDHAKPKQGELVPVLDYERAPAVPGPAEQFVVALHRELGWNPVFYSYLSFITSMRIAAASPLARCSLWLADYTSVRPAPPRPWHEITIWQHSSGGRLPGIGGPVDLDTGTPPVQGRPPITGYRITHFDEHGKRHTDTTTTPGRWITLHPKAKRNGHLGIDPIRKGEA